jgi:ubiquinone/menaquinone biosynthesis C-methylase UbiE
MINIKEIKGSVDRFDSNGLSGWAMSNEHNNAVKFDLYLEDIKVTTVKCNLYRNDLEKMREGGLFAFKIMFNPQALKLLPLVTKLKLVISGTSDIFYENTLQGEGGEIQFTGKNPEGKRLSLNKNGFLIVLLGDRDPVYLDNLFNFAKEIIDIFKDKLQTEAFIAYGSLLGAKRSGDVIPHDDDIDLSLYLTGKTPEEIEAQMTTITTQFSAMGFRIHKFSPTQFHIAREAYWVDIFVSWSINDDFYMTWAINGNLKNSDVFPLQQLKMRNHELPAPKNASRFLEALYGANWLTPDPSFDWKNMDVWYKLPNNYKYLSENIEKTTQYWEAFYSNPKTAPSWPSQFACFVLDEIHGQNITSATIMDIGCGNARDSAFFANNNFPVIGIDGAKEVVNKNNAKQIKNAKFHHCNFNDLASVLTTINQFKSVKNMVIYCRFFVHAIDQHAEDMLVTLCEKLEHCKMAAFEFRIQGDAEGAKETSAHYRRFQNQAHFIAKMEKKGFKKIYEVEGKGYAKYKRDDALVCRLLFSHR